MRCSIFHGVGSDCLVDDWFVIAITSVGRQGFYFEVTKQCFQDATFGRYQITPER